MTFLLITYKALLAVAALYILYLLCGDLTTIISRSCKNSIKSYEFFCDHCGANIENNNWLPIIGFIRLRGRAKCCGQKIARFYFITEIISILGILVIIGFLYNRPLVAIGAIAAFYVTLAFILCCIKYRFRFRFFATCLYLVIMLAHKLIIVGLFIWAFNDFGPLF